eukprot:1158209-Pelagomonas_calceolata.AAC.3
MGSQGTAHGPRIAPLHTTPAPRAAPMETAASVVVMVKMVMAAAPGPRPPPQFHPPGAHMVQQATMFG